mgnify:FL=1
MRALQVISGRDKAGRILARSEEVLAGAATVTKALGYTYDLSGRLERVSENGGQTAQYVYDANGNRKQKVTPVGTVSGTYDAHDRISRYCPQNAGGDPSPIMGLPCFSYTYRASGELATKTDLFTSHVTQYDYDERGALRGVTLPDGRVIEYELDPVGRRIGKKVGGVRQWGLIYQGSIGVAAQLDAANGVAAQFIYTTKAHVPELMLRASPGSSSFNTYRLITDHLGSVRLVVNTSDGSVAQRLEYDEFGNVLLDTNPGFQPFGFAGGLYDADTGLVRFGARDYDAVAGRWTAEDPILFRGGSTNLYIYVGNDPVNRFDPTGLLEWGFGLSVEFDVVAPFLSGGGGAAGLNLQYTSDGGLNLYVYTPVTDPRFNSAGFLCGAGISGNVAWGDGGPWSGNFYNVGGNVGPVSGGYFTGDPGPGPGTTWEGVSGGVGGGAPIGFGSTATNYTPVF